MIKVAISGYGKIGQLRFQELKKNSNTKIIAVHDTKNLIKLIKK